MSRRLRRSAGFTLLEVLVATSLLSVLMLGLFSALQSVGQAETRASQRLNLSDRQRQTAQLLNQLLQQVSEQAWRHPATAAGQKTAGLLTDGQSIEWVGTLPVRHGLGGRHFMRLSLERTAPDAAGRLVLQYQAWPADANQPDRFPDWQGASSRTLLDGVERLHIQARAHTPPADWPASKPWTPDWQAPWPHPPSLPEALRIDLMAQGQTWPPLFIGVRASPGTQTADDGFTVGGQR